MSEVKVPEALALIDRAVKAYKLEAVWALFSGGHDSATVTHVTSRHPLFAGVIHIDTGTGLPETEEYVRKVCTQFGWRLEVGKPSTTYEQLIIKYGFPGPAQHSLMYNMLKARPLRYLKSKVATGKTIGYATGVRVSESERRMGHVGEMRKDRDGIWINPIYDWSGNDCSAYMKENGIPRSEVKDTIHLSGECFCGAFANAEEYKELKAWYPTQAERIDRWEKLVATIVELKLNAIAPSYCRWGFRHRKADEQMELFPLCHFCREAREE